jgi:predicted MFS family arabinose efflux permease
MSPSSTNKWVALALLAAAQFVVILDASIVNVALPSIGKDLEFSQDNLSWVVNAYVLVLAASCSSAVAWRTCSDVVVCSSVV